MNDDNKNSDLPDEQQEFEDFEDAFEDSFEKNEEEKEEGEELSSLKEAAPSEAPVKRPPPKSGSLLPVVIGISVLIFLGWKLFGMFSEQSLPAQKTPPTPEAVSLPSEPALPVPEQPVLPSEPVKPSEPLPEPEPTSLPSPTTLPENNELTVLRAKITQQEQLYEQKLATFEKEIMLTRNNMAESARQLSTLQNDITMLSKAMQQLSEQVDTIRSYQERQEIRRQQQIHTREAPSSKGESSAEKLPSLTVYAIIPGRAWLRSANGKTLTVTEGDPIGEYGKVLKIDASSGVVITTSGATLR